MTVIDLGDLRDDAEPPPHRPRPPATGRPLRFALALLLVLGTVTGAAPAPAWFFVAVPGSAGAQVYLAGDQLLVADPVDLTGGGRQLTAYPLSAVRPLWRTPLPARGDTWPVLAGGDMVALSHSSDASRAVETMVLDARTGRVWWRQPGNALRTAGGDLLLETEGADGTVTVRGVDLASGRARWSRSAPGGWLHYRFVDDRIDTAGEVDRVVLTPTSGEVEIYDADSGSLLAGADVVPGDLPAFYRARAAGDLLLVLRNGPPTVTAYGVDRLERRWSVPLTTVDYALPCGALLCAFNQIGGMWALDPATGATRWSDPRWSVAWSVGDRLLARPGRQPDEAQSLVLLEGPTGRPVAELGSWVPMRQLTADTPPLLTRPGPGGRVLVAELDVAAGRMRTLDVLPDTTGDCQADFDLLLCRRTDGSFGLWRLDR